MSKQTKGGMRERQHLARRNAILDASRELTIEVGYEAMTMDMIAERALITKPTLYVYFENKIELVVAGMVNMILTTHEERIQGEIGLSTLDKLKYRFRKGMEAKFASGKPVYADPSEPIRTHPDYVAAIDFTLAHITELVQTAQSEGLLNPRIDPSLLGRLFLGVLGSIEFERMIAEGVTTPQATIETLSYQLLRGYMLPTKGRI